jgi:hypothetical protein
MLQIAKQQEDFAVIENRQSASRKNISSLNLSIKDSSLRVKLSAASQLEENFAPRTSDLQDAPFQVKGSESFSIDEIDSLHPNIIADEIQDGRVQSHPSNQSSSVAASARQQSDIFSNQIEVSIHSLSSSTGGDSAALSSSSEKICHFGTDENHSFFDDYFFNSADLDAGMTSVLFSICF